MGREEAVQNGMMGPMNGWGGYQALLVVVILLLLAVILVLYFRQRPVQPETRETEAVAKVKADEPGEGAEDKLEVALRLLDENERRVVEALVAKGGSMLQKDISHELGFSRVKAHRVVQSLSKRGLVTVEEHYNTNKIALVDWLTR